MDYKHNENKEANSTNKGFESAEDEHKIKEEKINNDEMQVSGSSIEVKVDDPIGMPSSRVSISSDINSEIRQINDKKRSIIQLCLICLFFTSLDAGDFISDVLVLNDISGSSFTYYLGLTLVIHASLFSINLVLSVSDGRRRAKAFLFVPVLNFLALCFRVLNLKFSLQHFVNDNEERRSVRGAIKGRTVSQLERLEILERKMKLETKIKNILDTNSLYLKIFEDVNQIAILIVVIGDSQYITSKLILSGLATVFSVISLFSEDEVWERKSHLLMWVFPSVVIGSMVLSIVNTGIQFYHLLSLPLLLFPVLILLNLRFRDVTWNFWDCEDNECKVNVAYTFAILPNLVLFVLVCVDLYQVKNGPIVVGYYSCILFVTIIWLIKIIWMSIGVSTVAAAGLIGMTVKLILSSCLRFLSWYSDQLD